MNQDELQERILMLNHLEQQDLESAAPYDPSEGMNEPGLKDFVRFLYGQVIEKDKLNQEILDELRKMRQDYKELLCKFDSLTQRMAKADLEILDLKEQNGVLKDELYNSSKSRKGIEKNRRPHGKHDEHDSTDNDTSS